VLGAIAEARKIGEHARVAAQLEITRLARNWPSTKKSLNSSGRFSSTLSVMQRTARKSVLRAAQTAGDGTGFHIDRQSARGFADPRLVVRP